MDLLWQEICEIKDFPANIVLYFLLGIAGAPGTAEIKGRKAKIGVVRLLDIIGVGVTFDE